MQEGEHGAGWDEADFAAEFFTFGGKDEDGGDALDAIVLGEGLFFVDVDADHEPVGAGGGDAWVAIGFGIKHFARSAPGGEEINHNGLTVFFGFGEGGRKIGKPIDGGVSRPSSVGTTRVLFELFLKGERQQQDGKGS